MSTKNVPLLTALNLDLRNEYVADCANGVKRWNQELEDAGLEERLFLPHQAFNRKVGSFAGHHVTPTGEIVDEATWERTVGGYLPTPDDRRQVAELMVPHYDTGDFASWISPPSVGINSMPVEYDYVRF
jgi:benzoyl-CoA 2,3-dioxygenase component B